MAVTVLRCESVSKRYRIRQEDQEESKRGSWLSRTLRQLAPPPAIEFWALRDINFELQRGETLGIIGHNGAGKSTLLKLLSNITTPTSGQILIQGKIAALLEVGSGFHPELSGRENIYLSGSILGMSRADIKSNFDAIIDFADIRDFLDVPVKRYSSGMYVRLGFAIAAHLHPDILLLDEVLAVGDSKFQQKCRDRIHDLKRDGTTIIFISHDLEAVRQVCSRAILLQKGRIMMDGGTDEVIARYQDSAALDASRPVAVSDPRRQNLGSKAIISSVEFRDGNGNKTANFITGEPIEVILHFEAFEDVPRSFFGVWFHTMDGRMVSNFSSLLTAGLTYIPKGTGYAELSSSSLGLLPGVYSLDVTIEQDDREMVEWLRNVITIRVHSEQPLYGQAYFPHSAKVFIADPSAK